MSPVSHPSKRTDRTCTWNSALSLVLASISWYAKAIAMKPSARLPKPQPSSYSNTIFKKLREWDPLIIILSIWTPRSHVKLINTILYFRRVVSIKMRVCWARGSTHLRWVDLNEDNMLVNLGWVDLNIKNITFVVIMCMPIQVKSTWTIILNGQF